MQLDGRRAHAGNLQVHLLESLSARADPGFIGVNIKVDMAHDASGQGCMGQP